MFYSNILSKKTDIKNNKPLSIKKLYILYTIFNKHSLNYYKSKPTMFYAYMSLIINNKTYLYEHVFFTILFFLKTQNTVFFKKLNRNTLGIKFNNLFSVYFGNNPLENVHFFWKKWGSLKRPETNESFSGFYVEDFKKKLNKYTALGLLNVYKKYIVIKLRPNITNKQTININKTLLVTPKYASSSINKNISLSELDNFEFQFLRKNKVYNKGRYSRTRQNYRTGVYMCMYVSIISVFGLYYWFYKFSFNFTYLWWFFIAFLGSFFFPKIIKYRLYEPTTLLSKFFDFFKWFSLLVKSIFF